MLGGGWFGGPGGGHLEGLLCSSAIVAERAQRTITLIRNANTITPNKCGRRISINQWKAVFALKGLREELERNGGNKTKEKGKGEDDRRLVWEGGKV